jgi:soluble lytic murein transglycosylase
VTQTQLAALVLTVALLGVACKGDKKEQASEPGVIITPLAESSEGVATISETPGVALTPQAGLNVDMATARRFEDEGDIESATAAYIAIAASDSDDRDAATLAAGRLLLELERPEDARLLLEPFVARDDLTDEDLAAHYLLARAYAALEMWQESVQEYDAYIATGRRATAYAYLDRTAGLLELDQPGEVVTSVQTGLSYDIPASQRRAFLLRIAEANERAGALPAAIDSYRALIDEGLSGDVSLALSRIIALKRMLGDPTYSDDLVTLMSSYPRSAEALDDMEEAVSLGESIVPWLRGFVYYRHNDYTNAEPAFQEQIALSPNAPESAEAYYYLAAIQESRGEIQAALDNYATATALNPQSSIADEALWWRARILGIDEALDEAAVLYSRIVSEYPFSQFFNDAAFQSGLLEYRRGNFTGAAQLWDEGASLTGGLDAANLRIWQAKALLAAGDPANAAPILQQLASEFEDDYPGVRARALLTNQPTIPRAMTETSVDLTPEFDWTAAEAWLTNFTGRGISNAGWSADDRWARAQELWRVGRVEYGDAEVLGLIEAYAGDAIAMYTMSRRLDELGRISMSARAGQRLLRVLDTNPNQGLPKPLLALSYPSAFATQVSQAAGENGVSPLLMLAFIRQESFFDPRAISPADARGLTQVIPPTAETIASTLGVSGFEPEQLLHAGLNLRFGARYMADQLTKFNNELFVAFAAYNAGPTAAVSWRDASGDDGDLFLETIEFHETQLYVEIVAENYAIYRYLYGGQPEPNLPP